MPKNENHHRKKLLCGFGYKLRTHGRTHRREFVGHALLTSGDQKSQRYFLYTKYKQNPIRKLVKIQFWGKMAILGGGQNGTKMGKIFYLIHQEGIWFANNSYYNTTQHLVYSWIPTIYFIIIVTSNIENVLSLLYKCEFISIFC